MCIIRPTKLPNVIVRFECTNLYFHMTDGVQKCSNYMFDRDVTMKLSWVNPCTKHIDRQLSISLVSVPIRGIREGIYGC